MRWQGLAALARHHARRLSLSTICFSGGVLHNRLLPGRVCRYTSDFTLLFPHHLPAVTGLSPSGRRAYAARSCSKDVKCYGDAYAMNLAPRSQLLALVMANLLAWGLGVNAFSSSSALTAASLLASVLWVCVTRWMLTTSRH